MKYHIIVRNFFQYTSLKEVFIMLVEITEAELRISEAMLKFATNDELRQLHDICENIVKRREASKEAGVLDA